MSENRMAGAKEIVLKDFTRLDRVHVHRLPSMEAAREKFLAAFHLPPTVKDYWKHKESIDAMAERMMRGDNRLESIVVKADELIDQALLIDSRLVRRSGWIMAEEGIDACPAMIAAGEERAYIDRRKRKLADQPAATQPVRIVISTDSKEITPDHASAFIAAAKLAQQFRPLEIWWQGAWLRADHEESPGCGHVFLVPLVNGDLDFARLQFVLSDADRDTCSHFVMFKHSYEVKQGFGGHVGERSYLEDTFDFIRESGMTAEAAQVASYAAHWAGLESRWDAQISDSHTAQYWYQPAPATPSPPPTPAQQRVAARREKQFDRDCEAARKRLQREQAKKAKSRLSL